MSKNNLGTSSSSLADGESRLAGTAQVAPNRAPAPYTTVDIGARAAFHTYILDANGRKIGLVWGPVAEKVWTAALFAAAPELLEMTKLLVQAAEYKIRQHRSKGDEEGARMATLTRNMASAAIAKAESP